MIGQSDKDYEPVDRSQSSLKYIMAQVKQPGINKDKAIFVSHADMEFKFAPKVIPKIYEMDPEPHYGYCVTPESTWKAVRQWVSQRYLKGQVTIDRSTSMGWSNMVVILNCVIEALTEPGSHILIPCPNYYRFISHVKIFNRVGVQTQMKVIDNRFHLDFEDIEKKIVAKKIKLMIFSNPSNPSGRIWKQEELQTLKDILLKHQVHLFSDEVFSDLVEPSDSEALKGISVKDKFTSMLNFQDFKHLLVYANSFSKAFNCSSTAMAYTICQNPEVKNRLYQLRENHYVWATSLGRQLLQACYTTEEARQWRTKTIRYVYANFARLQEFARQEMPKLQIFDMDTAYLCVIDFRDYDIRGKQLEDAFTKVNVCPLFLGQAFVDPKDCSYVRINLAIHHTVMQELLPRLKLIVS